MWSKDVVDAIEWLFERIPSEWWSSGAAAGHLLSDAKALFAHGRFSVGSRAGIEELARAVHFSENLKALESFPRRTRGMALLNDSSYRDRLLRNGLSSLGEFEGVEFEAAIAAAHHIPRPGRLISLDPGGSIRADFELQLPDAHVFLECKARGRQQSQDALMNAGLRAFENQVWPLLEAAPANFSLRLVLHREPREISVAPVLEAVADGLRKKGEHVGRTPRWTFICTPLSTEQAGGPGPSMDSLARHLAATHLNDAYCLDRRAGEKVKIGDRSYVSGAKVLRVFCTAIPDPFPGLADRIERAREQLPQGHPGVVLASAPKFRGRRQPFDLGQRLRLFLEKAPEVVGICLWHKVFQGGGPAVVVEPGSVRWQVVRVLNQRSTVPLPKSFESTPLALISGDWPDE